MVTERDKLEEVISSRIIAFFTKNKVDAKSNKTNGAVSAEEFVAGLFNILYKDEGGTYTDSNKEKMNYPGVDVLNKGTKKAVQVSVTNSLTKAKDSFKTIPKKEENTDYEDVTFVIQAVDLTSGLKKFGPEYEGYAVRVWGIPELLREVSLQDDVVLKQVADYVKTKLLLPDFTDETVDIDAEVFSLFFDALKAKALADYSVEEDRKYFTDYEQKKEKFASDWKTLETLYKESLGVGSHILDLHKLSTHRRLIEEVFSEDMDEVQKNAVISYLRVQSLIVLHTNDSNPVAAIKELGEQMRNDLRITFVPRSYLLSFLLNMFFTCDVFPLEDNDYEK